MNELQFADGVLTRILEREPRYHERAYLFVLAAIEYLQCRLPERRHVTGAELAWACRDLALDQFGLLARPVLEHWNIRTTEDLGRIVFTMVEVDLLLARPEDSVQDFADIYGFEDAFRADLVWERVANQA